MTYQVVGREADQWFSAGSAVTFLRRERNWIDKGTSEMVLTFAVTGRGEVPIAAESLAGLRAIVPEPPSLGQHQLAWKSLFTGDLASRRKSFSDLGRRGPGLWSVALSQRALLDREASDGLWTAWGDRPEVLQELEQALATSQIHPARELRHLLARAHRPYFLATLELELGASDPAVIRAALEEVELLKPVPVPSALRDACNHVNPSVAIKAQSVLKRLLS